MKKILLSSLLFLSSLSFSNTDFLNDSITLELKDSIITAEKFETPIRDTTKNVYIINKENIQNSGATNIVELLKTIPSIFIGSGYTNEGIIDFRGQGETSKSNVLILVDGISQNSIDMSGPDLSIIDINNIERIEVIPSSGVVYGDKAVGGVINIITSNNKNNIKLDVGSYGYSNSALNTSNTFGIFTINNNFSKTFKEGYREHSNYNKENFGTDIIININSNNKLTFTYDYNKSFYNYAGSLTKAQVENNRTDSISGKGSTFNRKNNYSLNYNYESNKLKLENKVSSYNKYSEGWSKINTAYFSNNLKIKYSFSNFNIINGIDFSEASSKTNSTNKIEKNQIGMFSLINYSILDNLIINGGYRNETTKLDYFTGKEKKYNQNLFSAGINYLYSDTGNVYLSFEQNYRTPTTDEYQYAIYNWATYEITGYGYKENLNPQKSTTTEIGHKEFFANTYINTTIFNTITTNEIFYNPSTFSNENIDGTTLRNGIEFSTKTNIKNIILSQSYTYLIAKINDGQYKNKLIPWVPKNRYNASINFKLNKLNFELDYNFVGKMYSISDWNNQYGKINSYSVVNFTSNYKFNNINTYFGIKNLTNTKYYDYVTYGSSYYPAEEKSYYIGINYEF
ncbi:outer membrane cobalamin receptor [Hypnocyclicus thermotrophus]|uniref:Outer membrane cobalamin receptor n=1 Tax=Hypnocyclicus thermotrophus TaxID=1627895 RepID=A0AA46DZV4_9FUSO|nr:TonB-dependent receptor [Hypnocyclicus thermotrophus]TDT72229.1 outer membrane cobalamin receptor [Hypnocyclicus thermotrophus]